MPAKPLSKAKSRRFSFAKVLFELRAHGLTRAQYKALYESGNMVSAEVDEVLKDAEVEYRFLKGEGLPSQIAAKMRDEED